MARFLGLIIGFALVFFSAVVHAQVFPPDGYMNSGPEAAVECNAEAAHYRSQDPADTWGCSFEQLSATGFNVHCTNLGLVSSGRYWVTVNGGHNNFIDFCVEATCTAGPVDSTGNHDYSGFWVNTDGTGGKTCHNGCMVQFQAVVAAKPDGAKQGWSNGFWRYTGDRCTASTGTAGEPTDSKPTTPDHQPPPPKCDPGVVSCYIPGRGACYGTESGEQVCTGTAGDGAPPANNCASGATGTVCAGGKDGSPPPPPPDPPIPKDSSPNDTQNLTVNTGGTNYTQVVNNYSGTSPGPGDAGSGGGTSSGGSTSPGGTGSNANGSGNSGSGSGGGGADGKCSDGSVPTASGCSGTYRDNGCDTPPACFGDAVLCGIAANTHKAACNPAGGSSVGTASGALAAAGVPADGGASSDPSPSGLVSSSDIGSDGFDTSGLGFSHTCPASPSFEVLGHSYTLDLTPFCNFASLLGWFVLLVAYLVGLRIVATGKA